MTAMPEPMSDQMKDAIVRNIIWSNAMSDIELDYDEVMEALERALERPLIDFDLPLRARRR